MALTIVIPMAGEGKRFAEKGYSFPKFLISIRGKPMLQWVVENLGLPDASYVFVCREEHVQKYALQDFLPLLAKKVLVVSLVHPTQGAADTVLQGIINGQVPLDDELVVANCDQIVEWNGPTFLRSMRELPEVAGGIVTFNSLHPKWSFVRLGEDGYVEEVAEKRPISTHATCGIYYYRRAVSFHEAVLHQMGELGVRVNGELYVAPTYNDMIGMREKVVAYPVETMWSLGTPEDLEEFRYHICR